MVRVESRSSKNRSKLLAGSKKQLDCTTRLSKLIHNPQMLQSIRLSIYNFIISPTALLLAWMLLLSGVWLLSNIPFAYDNGSDMGSHIYNLKRFSTTGFSWYNSQLYWGQEYLTVYAPGAYILGSAFASTAPGVQGGVMALHILVLL